MKQKSNTKRKAYQSLIIIFILVVMLAATTYAIAISFVSVDDNRFETGDVEIEINDGKAIFDDANLKIEPGYRLVKTFTVKNTGTADAYYRLYLENVEGGLQDSLIFSFYEGDVKSSLANSGSTVAPVLTGVASELTKSDVAQGIGKLEKGEEKTFTVMVKMTESAGNTYQGGYISFNLTAEAVQSKNNPDRVFS